MNLRIPVLVGVAASVLCACGPGAPLHPPVDTAKIVDDIKIDEVHWNADYRSGDASRVAGHYAPEAVVMSPGAPPAEGRAAIQAALGQGFNLPGFALTFASDRVDVARSGELAVARGHYSLSSTDPKTGAKMVEAGNYLTVYKPQPNGAWKAVWDINTPAGPATAAPTETPVAPTAAP